VDIKNHTKNANFVDIKNYTKNGIFVNIKNYTKNGKNYFLGNQYSGFFCNLIWLMFLEHVFNRSRMHHNFQCLQGRLNARLDNLDFVRPCSNVNLQVNKSAQTTNSFFNDRRFATIFSRIGGSQEASVPSQRFRAQHKMRIRTEELHFHGYKELYKECQFCGYKELYKEGHFFEHKELQKE
jgi:hypothetical protein